jgi:hypothetical protein
VAVVRDLRFVDRPRATDPAAALRGWLTAMRQNCVGYVIAALCPTARESEVEAPELGAIPQVPGRFALDDRAQVKMWLRTFARAGAGYVRWMTIGRVASAAVDGDVARVRVDLKFQAMPNWANIVSVVLFILIRLIGLIVGVILYYSTRRRHAETLEKILIRGRDDCWYVYDGELAGADG